jgi:hypothetical protein
MRSCKIEKEKTGIKKSTTDPTWVWDFHSGTKKPAMPKKKVFAARNLKD